MSLLSRLAVRAARAYGMLAGGASTNVSADYLVVAGGGAGGYALSGTNNGGGGGAGGYQASTFTLSTLNTYSIAVGAGGSGAQDPSTNGSNSSISGTGLTTVTSVGGGFGGSNSTNAPGGSGGSAGGAGNNTNATGTATSGQGNVGGNGAGAPSYGGGGGGGASSAGANATTSVGGGNGGNGTASSISGSSVTYAGGGGGGSSATSGTGGTGGGGNGSTGAGTSGTANTGGGGGGSGNSFGSAAGGNGGSGIVIISYTSAEPKFVGGTITTSGGKQIHTFTSSGTLSPITPITASYLVVAGGGSGGSAGYGGGGGAGGYQASSTTLYSGATYIVTIGAGGAAVADSPGSRGNNGSNSVVSGTGLTTITSTGGGGGGGGSGGSVNGNSGGSGGGGSSTGTGGAGTSGQGNNGAAGVTSTRGGGGGGAGAAATTGDGGNGSASSISGSSITYAGGGSALGGSTGGTGGGGAAGVSGTTNTGGGGGASASALGSGAGGSGIVIISYAGSQQFNGGLVTSSGGNTIHTFTSTGALTPLTNNLNNSLRFRASASAYLSKTFSNSGDQQKFTISFWLKKGYTSYANFSSYFQSRNGAGATYFVFGQGNGDETFGVFDSTGLTLITSAVYRDYSAWYHVVLAVDTTQATAANRVKLYVNGNQVTAFSTATYPTQNQNLSLDKSIPRGINTNAGYYFDAYYADYNFIDGQALEPYYFGNNDANGVWKPILYKGTYGTNGFYLNFGNTTSTTTLGYDSSPNGNNWTCNNISLTAGTTYDAMKDVPTNTSATVANYCTLNPVDTLNWLSQNASMTLTNGNLTFACGNAGNMTEGTMAVSSGKWYFEITVASSFMFVGIRATRAIPTGDLTYRYYNANGDISVCAFNSTSPTNVATVATATTNGDIIGVAFDLDSNTISWYKNNTLLYTLTGVVPDTYAPATGGAATATASINFGQRPFSYTPPTGYVALNTYNLPTPTILQGNKYMDATLYTGNGAGQTIVNQGQFYPDLIWVKSRSNATNNNLFTSVLSGANILKSNSTDGVVGVTNAVTAFNSNGFTLGSDSGSIGVNINSNTYVAWQWLAGATTGTTTNTNGSITSYINVNTTAGFSQVYWTGTAANGTLGHGLGVAPKFIITKCRGGSTDWAVWHTSIANTQYLVLNSTAAVATGATYWNSTSPTSSVFSVGSSNPTNAATAMVAYCFAEIAGYSKFGSYTGNGSTDGPFVYTGFRPKFVMYKITSAAGGWVMLDTSRTTYNVTDKYLLANAADAEGTFNSIDILSNGFKVRNSDASNNPNGGTVVYMAFAENPFKNANAR